jgi:peptidoglycan/LPS O-acetylase OafA/YrhL
LVVLEHAGVALWTVADGAGLEGRLQRIIVAGLELNLGGPLFFVMSGYCIASCIDSARRRGTAPLLFLARRVWRIFPAYWVALAGFVAVVAGLDAIGLEGYHRGGEVSLELASPGVLDASQWIGNLSLTESWRPLVGGREELIYTRVAWSLCYQEQFYLVCFLTLLLFPRRFERALMGITAVILAFRVFVWDAGALHRIAGTFPVLWHEFAVGWFVYLWLGRPAAPGVRRGLGLGLIALLIVALRTGLVSTAGAAGFGLLLIALHRWDDRLPGLRWLDPVRACGRRSYSIYLVHLPTVMVVNAWLQARGWDGFWPRALVMIPASVSAAVAVGWVFHRVIERHFLDLPAPAALGLAWRAVHVAWRPRLVLAPAPAALLLVPIPLGRGVRLVPRVAVRALVLAALLLVPVGLGAQSARIAASRPPGTAATAIAAVPGLEGESGLNGAGAAMSEIRIAKLFRPASARLRTQATVKRHWRSRHRNGVPRYWRPA